MRPFAALLLCLPAAAVDCDLGRYRAQAGLTAARDGEALLVSWDGERGSRLRTRLAVDRGTPTITELAVAAPGGSWVVLGRNLTPEFHVTSGLRRSGHGLPEENRWDVYWDAPLSIPGGKDGNPNLPRQPEEVRRATAYYRATACEAVTDGARLEVSFNGLYAGLFTGRLQMTVYKGTNLIRLEAIAQTDQPSVAYIYRGGLKGFSTSDLERLRWRDTGGNAQRYEFGGAPNQDIVPLRARNRLAVAEGRGASIAVFPPPHQFFFARQLEINLGFVYYRKDSASSFSLGVRQHDHHEGYNRQWVERVWALYNAPPGTWQRMPVYFYAGAGLAESTRQAALAFTRGDRYKPLPGYKTMVTHFHTGFTQELVDSGSLDTLAPWIPTIRALGVNIVYNCDFHGDGHPRDPGPLRLAELENYHEACRRHSDKDFLILPGEEPNAHLGGHYNILFPKPVYWTHLREPGRAAIEQHPKYGTVYRTASAEDVFEMARRENALIWQTHPRTKGSTFYPDRIRETDYFRSDQWLGAAFKALPIDLSQKRLCETRCFSTLDDMNNWGRPKYLLAEVDTYKKFPDYDPYGDFNVNYLKLDVVPPATDWSAVSRVLRAGQFFVTTGEVLIQDFAVGRNAVTADLEWTFPPEFVEVVWGDGLRTDRRVISATDRPAFGSQRFTIPLDLAGKKWVRFAAWDSAGNGAFTQPVHLGTADERR